MSDAPWEGCSVSRRLGVWYDERTGHWKVSGRYEHQAGEGDPHELVRLALAILEGNVPDEPDNGPPMDPEAVSESLPPAAADILGGAWDLALNRTGGLTDQQARLLAGGLMAAAAHLLRDCPGPGWADWEQPPFPFRMELERELGPPPAKAALLSQLQADLDGEALEDGADHPARETLERALGRENRGEVLEFAALEDPPAFAASLLRWLSDLEPQGSPAWQGNLLRRALGSGEVAVREAGIQLVERWRGRRLVKLLRQHRDDREWLQEHAQRVLRDLEG